MMPARATSESTRDACPEGTGNDFCPCLIPDRWYRARLVLRGNEADDGGGAALRALGERVTMERHVDELMAVYSEVSGTAVSPAASP